jgi:hypothetical protein
MIVDINEFIVKPVPKKAESVVVNIKNIDLREKTSINREDVMDRLQKLMKGLSVSPLELDISEAESEALSKTEKSEEKSESEALSKTEKSEETQEPEKSESEAEEEEKGEEETKEPDEKKKSRKTKKQQSIQEDIDKVTFSEEEPTPSHKKPKTFTTVRTEIVEKMRTLLDKYGEMTCENLDTRVQKQVVIDYLKMGSPHRGLLVYHGLGSGKTCISIAVAEGLKSEKQIIVMTPSSLKTNFFKEIKKCGDESYRINQRWTKKRITDRKEAEKWSNIMSLDVDYILEKGVWIGDKERVSELTAAEEEQVNAQIDTMIRAKYKHISYDKVTEEMIKKLTADGSKNPFDNCVVIVDEAHNFAKKEMRFYEYLMSATDCKLVFLTGTPIVDSPHEIAYLFNMLRGYVKTWAFPLDSASATAIKKMFEKTGDKVEYKDKKLCITRNPFESDTNDKKFVKDVMNTLSKNGIEAKEPKVTNYKILPDDEKTFDSKYSREWFQRRILGLTSYFKGAPEELFPKYDANRDFVVIRTPMSEYQKEEYESALKKDDKEKTQSRQVCNFPEKKGDKPLSKEVLELMSPKLLALIENIEDEPESRQLVYSEISCDIVKDVLLGNGFSEFKLVKSAGDLWDVEEEDKEDKETPKFVYFSGIKDEVEKEKVRSIFNGEDADIKSNIRVIIIGPEDAEGVSLKNTRFVHILEPSRSCTRLEQVVGRARRVCSHVALPKEEQTVKAYLYMSTLPKEETTDQQIFETANTKNNMIQEVLSTIKETAIDCGLYDKDAVCFEETPTIPKGSKTAIVGGRKYLVDKEQSLYDFHTKKKFGKLVQEGEKWEVREPT